MPTAALIMRSLCRQGSNADASTSQGWCKFGIKLPHINWKSVVDNAPINFAIQGPESLCPSYILDGGIKVIVVECLMGIAPALAELRISMQVRSLLLFLACSSSLPPLVQIYLQEPVPMEDLRRDFIKWSCA